MGNLPYKNCISTFVILDSKDFVDLSKMKLAIVAVSIAVVVAITITLLIVICSKKRKEGYNQESARGASPHGMGGRYATARGLDYGQHSYHEEFRKSQQTKPEIFRRVPVKSDGFKYKDGIRRKIQNVKDGSIIQNEYQ